MKRWTAAELARELYRRVEDPSVNVRIRRCCSKDCTAHAYKGPLKTLYVVDTMQTGLIPSAIHETLHFMFWETIHDQFCDAIEERMILAIERLVLYHVRARPTVMAKWRRLLRKKLADETPPRS